jgi:hypothetical protein
MPSRAFGILGAGAPGAGRRGKNCNPLYALQERLVDIAFPPSP